jgi:hypothetical protein
VLLIRKELKIAADAAVIAAFDTGAALATSAANVTKCKYNGALSRDIM